MTYEEAMKRLMACPVLPRGERMPACVNKPRSLWVGRGSWPLDRTWYLAWKGDARTWKRQAAPLRRAREMNRNRREMNLALVEQFHRYIVDVEIGAALLGFFTELSVLVRRTPAPCPWCGGEDYGERLWMGALIGAGGESFCVGCKCSARGQRGGTKELAVERWNRVAVVAAFARLKDGE